MTTPSEILAYWFSDRVSALWFNSTPEFDREILETYGNVFESAINGEFDSWKKTSEGALALVIVLDQFPLNMYRGQPRCFSGEAKSIEIAKYAVDNQLDDAIDKNKKAFLYMPFMHSEKLEDQDRAIMLFEAAGLKDNLRYAHHHREIVKKFGRFPHRNSILGRTSTEEELTYLSSKAAFLG